MLSAAIMVVMGPAIGRLPIAPPTVAGFTIQLIARTVPVHSAFIRDRRILGHVHPATKLGFAMAAITVVIPLAVFWFNLPWARIAAASSRSCCGLGGFRLRHRAQDFQRFMR